MGWDLSLHCEKNGEINISGYYELVTLNRLFNKYVAIGYVILA